MKFEKVLKNFTTYGNKVVEILKKKYPESEFTLGDVMKCYGMNWTASECAKYILLRQKYYTPIKEKK